MVVVWEGDGMGFPILRLSLGSLRLRCVMMSDLDPGPGPVPDLAFGLEIELELGLGIDLAWDPCSRSTVVQGCFAYWRRALAVPLCLRAETVVRLLG